MIKKQKRIKKSQLHKKNDFPYEPAYHAKIWEKVHDRQGYPAEKPPWGTLSAIDLKTGDYFGRFRWVNIRS